MPTGSRPHRGDPPPRDPARLHRLAHEVSARRYSEAYVTRMRAEIRRHALTLSRHLDGPNFTRVGRDDVERMIRLYDERFFGGEIVSAAAAEGLSFDISPRMTSAAGKLVTSYPGGDRRGPRRFRLTLSSTLLFQTFADVDRPVTVTGHLCRDRLEAMQRIAEHELVHLAEILIWDDGDCSQPRFRSIATRIFGHTDFSHQLITQRERAVRKYGLRVGDRVRFACDSGILIGRINRITRRATVLVPDPHGEPFSDGHRYRRYYVPLDRLSKV